MWTFLFARKKFVHSQWIFLTDQTFHLTLYNNSTVLTILQLQAWSRVPLFSLQLANLECLLCKPFYSSNYHREDDREATVTRHKAKIRNISNWLHSFKQRKESEALQPTHAHDQTDDSNTTLNRNRYNWFDVVLYRSWFLALTDI